MELKFEGNDLEYKKAKKALPDSFWETYSAFANTNGGKVVLGVDENNEDPFQGVMNPEKVRNDLFNLVSNRKKVSCNLLTDNDIEYIDIPDKNRQLMVITIREASSDQKPVHLKND